MRRIYSKFFITRCRILTLKVKWMISWDLTDLWTEDRLLDGRENQLSADVQVPLRPRRSAILRSWTAVRHRRRRQNRGKKRQEKPRRLPRIDLFPTEVPWTSKRTITRWYQLIERMKKTNAPVLPKLSSRRIWQKTWMEMKRMPGFLRSRIKHRHLEKVTVKLIQIFTNSCRMRSAANLCTLVTFIVNLLKLCYCSFQLNKTISFLTRQFFTQHAWF